MNSPVRSALLFEIAVRFSRSLNLRLQTMFSMKIKGLLASFRNFDIEASLFQDRHGVAQSHCGGIVSDHYYRP